MCSDLDLHNLSYTISPSVDYVDHHSFNPFYSASLKSFNIPAYSYVSEGFLHCFNNTLNCKPSHSSLAYSPVIDNHRFNDKSFNKLKKKQLFVNRKSEMQCNSPLSKITAPKASGKLCASAYFDPESLVSFTLQSNAKKSCNSKSTPCLIQQTSPTEEANKTPKSKRKSTINWPFRRSNSNSTIKQKQQSSSMPNSFEQHKNKTVSMLHKKLLSKSQSNIKKSPGGKSPKATTLSIMSTVTLKRTSNKKQTIKLFGQPISKLCLGDRHLIAPVKNMLIELMQRAAQTVGIFRKSANARVCRELKAELEQNPDCNLSEYPIVVIASVFKELLRSLPDSLLVGKLYQKWLEAAKLIDDSLISDSECTAFIRPLIKCLPKANYLLLQHFLCILHYISTQSSENKMSAENLAVCIGPSLLNHDVAPASMHCELSKQVPKLISYLIKNCAELFGANTLTLFDACLTNEEKENKKNQNYEDAANKLLNEKNANKDSGAEESDSLPEQNSSNDSKTINTVNGDLNNELTKNLNNQSQPITNLYIKDHLHYQLRSPITQPINTFSSSASFTSSFNESANSTPKIYQSKNNNLNSNSSVSSSNKAHRLQPTGLNMHQCYFSPMLSQQPVNKVSLSNLSRDSGLMLSDTQLYSPEEDDDEDDYHHIINQHLHLSKKLNSIMSDKCLPSKSQFKINSNAKKIANSSTSLKKKCSSKINGVNMTSSEEDDLHDDLEDVDIDELSEKSCASENCAPLYRRVYNKRGNSERHHLLTKSAPQLANIETITHVSKQILNDQNSQNNKATCAAMSPYLHDSIKNNKSLSISPVINFSCNSPSSNLSSNSLNLSSSNEYPTSELQRNYFASAPQSQLASTPISVVTSKDDNALKSRQSYTVTSCEKTNDGSLKQADNNLTNKSLACNVSLTPFLQKSSTILPVHYDLSNNLPGQNKLNNTINHQPPSYQETMNRKEIHARIANLTQAKSNTSRKISGSEIDNLISKKIYEESIRVYNSDAHKDLKLRAVPVQIKIQSSSDSDSDYDQYSKHQTANCNNNIIKVASKPVDQIDGYLSSIRPDQLIRSKPVVQQRCSKDQTEYWRKNVNWSVATLRKKFNQLGNQNEGSTLKRVAVSEKLSNTNNGFKSTGAIYELCKTENQTKEASQFKELASCPSQVNQLSENGSGNCVTIIQVMHGQDKLVEQGRSTDSLSGEESYV